MERPIMINAAMEDVEMNVLKSKINIQNKIEEKVCTFYEGTFNNYPIVLCNTGVGMVNAAMATTIGINRYNPRIIVIEGVAGAHSKDLHKFDVVVSTDIMNINSIKTSYRKQGEGVSLNDWKFVDYGNDKEIPILNANEELIRIAQSKVDKYKKGKVFFGRIGSGDIWNKEVDRILSLSEEYKTLCEEMEGYAVFQVAEKYGIPAIDIRAISNNEVYEEEYDRSIGDYSQEFALEIIKGYLDKIRQNS